MHELLMEGNKPQKSGVRHGLCVCGYTVVCLCGEIDMFRAKAREDLLDFLEAVVAISMLYDDLWASGKHDSKGRYKRSCSPTAVLWGQRLVHAASGMRLCRHPEVDAFQMLRSRELCTKSDLLLWLRSSSLFEAWAQHTFTNCSSLVVSPTPSVTSNHSINVFGFDIVQDPIADTGDKMTILKDADVWLETRS